MSIRTVNKARELLDKLRSVYGPIVDIDVNALEEDIIPVVLEILIEYAPILIPVVKKIFMKLTPLVHLFVHDVELSFYKDLEKRPVVVIAFSIPEKDARAILPYFKPIALTFVASTKKEPEVELYFTSPGKKISASLILHKNRYARIYRLDEEKPESEKILEKLYCLFRERYREIMPIIELLLREFFNRLPST